MKKILPIALSLALTAALFSGCSATPKTDASSPVQTGGATVGTLSAAAPAQAKAPKYVFLFIGDGMSYPQFQSAADYLGAMADSDYMQAVPSLDDNQGAVLDGRWP